MSFATYADLQAEIAAWLNRTDLTAKIPTFITLAEAQMNQRLRVRPMLTSTTLSIAAETATAPTDLLEVKFLRLTSGSGRELSPVTEEQAQSYKSQPSQVTAEPRAYVLRATAFEFAPIPDTTYSASLSYYQKIPALSDSNTSNWVLATYPHAYLYGALMAGSPYIRRDDRVSLWAQLYADALDDIRTSNRQAYEQSLRVDPGLRGRRTFNILTGE